MTLFMTSSSRGLGRLARVAMELEPEKALGGKRERAIHAICVFSPPATPYSLVRFGCRVKVNDGMG